MNNDPTEQIRREQVHRINSEVKSDDKDQERTRLEEEYGQVWDTSQVSEDFEVIGFMAPYTVVRRLSDSIKGSLQFQHSPRLYFNFRPE